MANKYADKDTIDEVIRVGMEYTDKKASEIGDTYDQRFQAMLDVINAMATDIGSFKSSITERVENVENSITSMAESITQSINLLSNKIDGINDSITSLSQDFDNLDTQVNGIASDMATVKDAMGKMITNIVPDGNGGLVIHHYDGTIDENTVVEAIEVNEIDDIIFGYDKLGDGPFEETDPEEPETPEEPTEPGTP